MEKIDKDHAAPDRHRETFLDTLVMSTIVMMVLSATSAGTTEVPVPQQFHAGVGDETAIATPLS